MKSIAIIISVYILALTAMPCVDVHAHAIDINDVSVELHEQGQGQSNDVDFCSPLCFCNCCQTHSPPAAYNNYQIDLVYTTIITAYPYQKEITSTFHFWRPPQY